MVPQKLSGVWPAFVSLLLLLLLPHMAAAGPANTTALEDVPQNLVDYRMYLYLSIRQSHGSSTFQYLAAPLTPQVGLGDPNAWKVIDVQGNAVAVNASNYQTFNASQAVAFIACDILSTNSTSANSTSSNATSADITSSNTTSPNTILNAVMDKKPTAIVLYSLEAPGCSLGGDNLTYTSIWTMVDIEQTYDAIDLTNTTDGFLVSISGNSLRPGGGPVGSGPPPQNNNNSAVAMSILYSITGLITLLFLIIIVTGAVRAHRNPERYGPRAATAGRARQSRAKGIARAVLETLPIVKFGDPKPTKPDPEIEIDTLPGDCQRTVVAGNDASYPLTRPSTDGVDASATMADANSAQAKSKNASALAPGTATGEDENEKVGCSICTEDFRVGEDVRVLPCDHNFHPACIDPWLVNVSGTCPLCRLDLRQSPSNDSTEDRTEEMEGGLQQVEGQAEATGPSSDDRSDSSRQGHRISRLLHPGRRRSEHVDPLTMVENRQTHMTSEGSEQEQRRMERLLRVFRVRTRRQESPSTGSASGAAGPSTS